MIAELVRSNGPITCADLYRLVQLLNLLGYAITVNSLALHRHWRVVAPPGQLAA